MQRAPLIAVTLTCSLVCASTFAGPLNPPAGPVAPTTKTLQEVEPRTPISSQSVITSRGSYYLTNNIVANSGVGITIQAQGVTLDLNGFGIIGDGSGSNSDHGISIDTGAGDPPVTIRNGFVSNFAGDGIRVSTTIAKVVIEGVHVKDCRSGFNLNGECDVRDCVASSCSATGFSTTVTGRFENCLADDNGSEGFRVPRGVLRACAATNNVFDGFRIAGNFENLVVVASDCIATANGGAGFYCEGPASLSSCVAAMNGLQGLRGDSALVCRGCLSYENLGPGIDAGSASTLSDCLARSNNSNGFILGVGSTATSCTAHQNALDGFSAAAACALAHCTSYLNGVNGFDLGSDSHISFCAADANSEDGIEGSSDCTIDSNLVTDNMTGIVGGTNSLVIRNRAAGNTGADYDLAGSNAGPIAVDASVAISPWVNFDF